MKKQRKRGLSTLCFAVWTRILRAEMLFQIMCSNFETFDGGDPSFAAATATHLPDSRSETFLREEPKLAKVGY